MLTGFFCNHKLTFGERFKNAQEGGTMSRRAHPAQQVKNSREGTLQGKQSGIARNGGGKVKVIARDKQEGDGWQVASLPQITKAVLPA